MKLNPASKDPSQLLLGRVQDQVRKVLEFNDDMPAAGTITKISPETTRVGPATRYDMTADLTAIAGPINDPAKRALFGQLAKAGVSTLYNSVLIDSYNHPLPRRRPVREANGRLTAGPDANWGRRCPCP